MIQVTKPYLPSLEEYKEMLDGIWQRNWLTNNGPLVNQLELKMKEYLQLPHFLYVSNGTIALQIAIKALDLNGEIITTPFSYVATTSSIVWEGCKPVFVDIDENTLNISPEKIEAAITPKTSAILATHVYGNPCAIDQIATIARKHNLKVIYDGAHAFGTKYKGKSVFAFGDIVTTSFHATKLYHTIEGGGQFTSDPELVKKMAAMRNFGHDGPENFSGIGINGKNSEFHAAMGIINLRKVDAILEKRKKITAFYDSYFKNMDARKQSITPDTEYNYAYYPLIFKDEKTTLLHIQKLEANRVYPRRYFYPTLNKLNYVTQNSCPVSEDISKRIICIPCFHDISEAEMEYISRIILRTQNN